MIALYDQEKITEQFGYEKVQEGALKLLVNLVKTGEMSAERAAPYANMTLEQFLGYIKA